MFSDIAVFLTFAGRGEMVKKKPLQSFHEFLQTGLLIAWPKGERHGTIWARGFSGYTLHNARARRGKKKIQDGASNNKSETAGKCTKASLGMGWSHGTWKYQKRKCRERLPGKYDWLFSGKLQVIYDTLSVLFINTSVIDPLKCKITVSLIKQAPVF